MQIRAMALEMLETEEYDPMLQAAMARRNLKQHAESLPCLTISAQTVSDMSQPAAAVNQHHFFQVAGIRHDLIIEMDLLRSSYYALCCF